MSVAVLIPTLNAGPKWADLLETISSQTCIIARKIVIDSGSSDDTLALARRYGFEILTIRKEDFDHGYARQILAESADDCEILVYLTQDAILEEPESLAYLVKAFDDPGVGLAYGRQLPHNGAEHLEAHARLFNYPGTSIVKKLSDKSRLGIKTASCSNSFAAYRKSALQEVGGFPKHTIFAEDVIVGGQMLIKGWYIAYVAESKVYHSHAYSTVDEFKRYFDIGVYHSTNQWLLDEFGKADGEGFKYLKSEFGYVMNNNKLLLPKMVLSIMAKFVGYKLGMSHKSLSLNMKKRFSMHRRYWEKTL